MLYAFPKWAVYGVSCERGPQWQDCFVWAPKNRTVSSLHQAHSPKFKRPTIANKIKTKTIHTYNPQGNNPQLLGKRFYVPVWTGVEVCQAVANQVPNRLPGGADCGAAFSQLQPVMPQTANDVRAGETFFVLDVSRGPLV